MARQNRPRVDDRSYEFARVLDEDGNRTRAFERAMELVAVMLDTASYLPGVPADGPHTAWARECLASWNEGVAAAALDLNPLAARLEELFRERIRALGLMSPEAALRFSARAITEATGGVAVGEVVDGALLVRPQNIPLEAVIREYEKSRGIEA